MKAKIFLVLAIASSIATEFNPNPAADWDAMLAGIAIACVAIAVILRVEVSRFDVAVGVYCVVSTATRAMQGKLDPYAFFLGFGIFSLVPLLMMLGVDKND